MSIFDLPACLSANVSAKKAVRHPTFPRTAGLCSQKRKRRETFLTPRRLRFEKNFSGPISFEFNFSVPIFLWEKRGVKTLGKARRHNYANWRDFFTLFPAIKPCIVRKILHDGICPNLSRVNWKWKLKQEQSEMTQQLSNSTWLDSRPWFDRIIGQQSLINPSKYRALPGSNCTSIDSK